MANARLLMPTVRSTQNPLSSPTSPVQQPTRSPRIKPTSARLIRARSGSASAAFSSSPDPNIFHFPVQDTGSAWLGKPYRFELIPGEESLQLVGYQLYAVEKWVVERTRPVTVLTVYTGDPQHTITVTALSPLSTLTPAEAEIEWNSALHYLRRDGARQKETPLGTLMVTSLAHFRSDYTIVHIPNGDFLAVRERLYTNINLMRMGCSGRSALTLEEPSETTKDRFRSTYFLSDSSAAPVRLKTHSRQHTRTYSQPATAATFPLSYPDAFNPSFVSPSTSSLPSPPRHPLFSATVLELVKFLQASIAICGMFPTTYGLVFDGLLCDATVEGLQSWVTELGEHCVDVEAMERVADPSIVAALLSFILTTRNKLAAIGYAHVVPKDPFIHPQAFLAAMNAYSQAANASQSNGSTPLLPHISTPLMGHSGPNFASVHTSPGATNSSTHTSPFLGPPPMPITPVPEITYLTLDFSKTLTSAHDQKLRHTDSRRVHRVLLSKLDREDNTDTDISSENEHLRTKRKGIGGSGGQLLMSGIENLASGFVGRGPVGAGGIMAPTADLGVFVRAIIAKGDKEKGDKERDKGGEWTGDKDRDEGEKDKERIGGSLRALWTGKTDLVLKMRERAEGGGAGKERLRDKKGKDMVKGKGRERERLTSSDLDHEDAAPLALAVSERVDSGKSNTEDEFAFGGIWSGRVQKKLELWAGLNRSKRSVDLNLSPVKSGGGRTSAVPMSAHSSSSGAGLPVFHDHRGLGLPSVVISGDGGEEDELLSSGQISPISETKTHNPLTFGLESAEASSAYLGTVPEGPFSASEYDKRLNAFLMRRPKKSREDSRISSWSGPSTWEGEDGLGKRRKGQADGKSSDFVEGRDESSDAEAKKRILGRTIRRRHSFQVMTEFKDVRVLRLEWMRIDVDLCGQLLVMRRREAHLQNVLACLEHLSTSLSFTNASLRSDYHTHQPLLSSLEMHTELVQQIEAAREEADSMTQQVQALIYESNQFRIDELWRTAIPPRQKVLELREKVFGMGGRRLIRGARVQWTLDGQERIVDAWGRTESEAEEEKRAGAGIVEEDEEDEEIEEAAAVEHTAMKPMWLLRFFTSWSARWGWSAVKSADAAVTAPSESGVDHPETDTTQS
ncbi:hypothetical protein BJ138DRAFT_1144062 [Hygrophoropsis aurantiaca]|uniref:Uncharacterized protein n=1 Tax=Hygrophoropsis aurantiaca TaxID=72124 RepID=A0ACB8AMW1_9AGAM|nr:hypothetical protein BJ138DRAFT_1144062 [Hygrophoropsis aurantiaca]